MKRFSIASALWLAIILVLCAITVSAELDRESRMRPDLATSVPSPFRAFALEDIVAQGIARQDPASVLAQARRLVAIRPIPAEHLRMLAQAEMAAGHASAAQAAISAAATRGWRDPIVQFAVLQSAVSTRDWETAAQRLAAIWAIQAPPSQQNAASALLLAHPQAYGALADVLSTNVLGREAVLASVTRIKGPVVASQIALDAVRKGSRFDCKGLAHLARLTAQGGQAHLANALWTTACDPAHADADRKAGFIDRTANMPAGPFEWSLTRSGAIRAEREGQAISYSNHTLAPAVIASRLTGFAPGPVQIVLATKAAGHGGMPATVPEITMACVPSRTPVAVARRGMTSTFTVPNGCGTQQITVMAPPGSGRIARIRVAD